MAAWDEQVDFLVVGAGGGGMTAAIRAHDLGASSLIIEKSARYGGSTALSGGVIWVPANPCMSSAGVEDSAEQGFAYLEKITGGSSTPERLRAYVETAPRMMEYLAECSWLRFQNISDYPDYYPEEVGGKSGGRSCEPREFDARRLGEEFDRQRFHPDDLRIFGFLTVLASEGKPLMQRGWEGTWILLREVLRYFLDVRGRVRGLRNRRLTLGGALVGRARLSLLDRGVPLWLNTRLEDLVVEEGRVVGVAAMREGAPVRIRARRGVLLAAGGFEQNPDLRSKHQRAPIGSDWTVGSESNTGDTLPIGERVGADFDLLDDSWWCPVIRVPGESCPRVVVFEKNLPGGIIVNRKGERFMNEAAPYNDVVKSMYRAHSDAAPAIPAHLVFDRTFRRKYPVGPISPAGFQPDRTALKKYQGFMKRAETLEALAREIGVDPQGLRRTVSRFNEFARDGRDLDFRRGESVQDRYYTVLADGPNPSLAPIERGPFYAVEIWPGDLGTKGGLRTDARARVLSTSGQVIPGIYATGNCAAAPMGRTYPGAGGTIGPSMTFGFIAAEHAMGAMG